MQNFKRWLIAALIRALKTMAQSIIASIGVTIAFNELNWYMIGSIALTAGILSMLTSIAGLPEVKTE